MCEPLAPTVPHSFVHSRSVRIVRATQFHSHCDCDWGFCLFCTKEKRTEKLLCMLCTLSALESSANNSTKKTKRNRNRIQFFLVVRIHKSCSVKIVYSNLFNFFVFVGKDNNNNNTLKNNFVFHLLSFSKVRDEENNKKREREKAKKQINK